MWSIPIIGIISDMFKRFFTRKQTSILSAAFAIAAMVFTSRVLGLVRNRLLTSHFTPDEIDLYFAALRIPNFLYEILIAGAITVAFIPVFTSYLSQKKQEEAFTIAAIILNIAGIIVSIAVAILIPLTPLVLRVIVPGFTDAQIAETVYYTRIVLVLQVLPLVIGNIITGILQSFKRFLIPAMAPVVYNIGSIFGIVVLTPAWGLSGAIYGIGLGAVLFLIIQLPLLATVAYHHRFIVSLQHKGLWRLVRLMLPRTFVVGASQVDATIDFMLASLIGPGSITVFAFAQQLQLLPIGLFGLPIAQAALPTLSEYAAEGKIQAFKDSILTSLHQILFFVFPASAMLIVLQIPIVRLFYGADQFDWPVTVMTGRTIMYFSFSLFAQSMILLFSRAFFALQDSRTPVIVAVGSIVLNSLLSLLFVMWLRLDVWSLGLSTSISSIIHAFALLYVLDKKVHAFDRTRLFLPFIKIMTATAIMAIFIRIPVKLLDTLVFDTTRTFSLLVLTGIASCIGLATYIFFAWFFNIKEVLLFMVFARKLTKVKDILFEPSREVGGE